MLTLGSLTPSESPAADPAGFTLPKLPYAFDALEPSIDAKTMEIHHDKHHKAYVDNLNKPPWPSTRTCSSRPVDELMRDLAKLPVDDADPHGRAQQRRRPLQPLAFLELDGPARRRRADRPARRRDQARRSATSPSSGTTFKDAAMKRFGSGWAWLVADGRQRVDRQHRPTRTRR